MALPIKPKDTQEGCNPISSNCVIWQGPDIPCINLCNGDSVSDVIAKLAERLCTIADQLDISLLDLSCFNPLCPTPENFRDVIQLLIDKICDLDKTTNEVVITTRSTSTSGTGCPDNCIVTIAPCFQENDFLGNLITTLPLKDYLIKIGNEVCSILTIISTIQSSITDLDTRVTYIEDNCCDRSLNVFINSCLTGVPNVPLVSFVIQLEQAVCDLLPLVGTSGDVSVMLSSSSCVSDFDQQLAAPPAVMSALSGWVIGAGNIAQTIGNLWLTVCDLRAAVATLQTDLATCCAAPVACPTPTITLQFCSPNLGFSCTPLPGTWTITSVTASMSGSKTNTNITATIAGPFTYDGITCNTLVNTNTNALLSNSLIYDINYATFTLDDGAGNTCTITEVLTNIDGDIACPAVTFAPAALPVVGELDFGYAGFLTGYGISLQIQVFNCATGANVSGIITLPEAAAGTITLPEIGLFTTGDDYKVSYAMTQNGITVQCGETTCATAP